MIILQELLLSSMVFYFLFVSIKYLIYFQMLPKKKLGVKSGKKQNEKLKKSQQWAKKNYDVLYKGPLSHIMPKTRKTLGTVLVASDEVEPKPAKNEAFGDGSNEGSDDVKPTVNVKSFKVKITFQARIGKIEEPKSVPISVVCKGRDTTSFFTTNARWRERQELLDWVRRQGVRAEFSVCIDKSVIKRPYLTMQCERCNTLIPSINIK